MEKLDDNDARELLGKFLEHAFASAVRTQSDFEKIAKREAGLRLNHGITFCVDRAMRTAENAIVSRLVSHLGPQLGHYKEVADVLWDVAAKGFSDGKQPNDPSLAASCFSKMHELSASTVQFVHPAYNVVLTEGVKEIQIGPVAIRSGLDVAARLSKQNDKITFGIEHPPGFQTGGGVNYNVSETMWDIEVASSSAARIEHASWLTCIATSLIRLVVEYSNMGPLFPRSADVENLPFEPHRTFDDHITVIARESFSMGGGKAGRHYELGKQAKRSLSDKALRERISQVFDPPNKSLAQRFSQGLGWLAKGRQAKDRSDRFLFFFTALEALLSSDDKTSPIVQTIARHAAVLWTNDISERVKISRKIRKLYATRSALVHAGTRSVTYEGASEIHQIAENVFFAVWDTVDLKMKHMNFCEKLSEASYGLPYFNE